MGGALPAANAAEFRVQWDALSAPTLKGGPLCTLHIGQNEILPDRRIIGIFDLDKCSYGRRTREYLAAAEKEGVVLGRVR